MPNSVLNCGKVKKFEGNWRKNKKVTSKKQIGGGKHPSPKVLIGLILSSQASARFSIVVNTARALTAQKSFLNNFESVINRRVDIQEDIKRYRDTLTYASSKVDYSVGENIYMLPNDMNLNIKTGNVGYNNKILISDGKFSLGKNDQVNTLEPAVSKHTSTKISHKDTAQPTTTYGLAQKPTITHEEEKLP